jgi:hypothetical protein
MDYFESQIAQNAVSNKSEKGFIDKISAREDIDKLGELIQKPVLNRSDILQIMYMLTAMESKFVNYNEWDRYYQLKYFVWIREFVKNVETYYEYREYIQKKNVLSDDAVKMLDKVINDQTHNLKFLCDLYVNIARTSLSLKGAGFFQTLANKFEFQYTDQRTQTPEVPTSSQRR